MTRAGLEATVVDLMAALGDAVAKATRERRLRSLLKNGTFRVFDGRVQLLRQRRCGDCSHRHVGDRCKFEWCSDCGDWPTAEELSALASGHSGANPDARSRPLGAHEATSSTGLESRQ